MVSRGNIEYSISQGQILYSAAMHKHNAFNVCFIYKIADREITQKIHNFKEYFYLNHLSFHFKTNAFSNPKCPIQRQPTSLTVIMLMILMM